VFSKKYSKHLVDGCSQKEKVLNDFERKGEVSRNRREEIGKGFGASFGSLAWVNGSPSRYQKNSLIILHVGSLYFNLEEEKRERGSRGGPPWLGKKNPKLPIWKVRVRWIQERKVWLSSQFWMLFGCKCPFG